MSTYYISLMRQCGLLICAFGLIALVMYTPTAYHASVSEGTVYATTTAEPSTISLIWRATVSMLPRAQSIFATLNALYEWHYPFGVGAYIFLIVLFSACVVVVWCRLAYNARTLFGFFKNRFVDK